MSVRLLPAPRAVAQAVLLGGSCVAALDAAGLAAAPGWPHEQSATALRATADYGEMTGTFLVVEDISGHDLVHNLVHEVVHGECGWRAAPDADGDVEISFGLAAPSRGAGRGSAAVAALLLWSRQQPGVHTVSAQTQPGNAAAIAVLEGRGFILAPTGASTDGYLRYVTSLTVP